ncbi:MAG: hypothetical protein ACR2QW_08625 [bacterium]
MDAFQKAQVEPSAGHQELPRHHVDVNDLALLLDAINYWDQFLDRVFIVPTAENMSADILEQMSLEDAEYYLDVKIQLSQCLRTVQGRELKQRFEDMCGRIRKATYHHISTTLPQFADNSRSLLELAHKDDRNLSDSGVSKLDWVPSPDLVMSQEYKDCLVLERKQLKSEAIRQRSLVKSQIVRLIKEIRGNFFPQPG